MLHEEASRELEIIYIIPIFPYTFLPATCIVIEDVDLDWDDFVEFNKILYSIIVKHEHLITKFPNLLQFLDS
jgi:hypothetical protein